MLVISIYGMTKITATGNVTSDLPKDDPILLDLKFVERNFGGSIPFEITINYKEKGRLLSNKTLKKVELIQETFAADTLFSKSLSFVDFLKSINMAYHGNNPDQYKLISSRDKLRLKQYFDKFDLSDFNGGNLSLKDLIDTTNTTLRIRCQMKDVGSYEVATKVDSLRLQVDEILNPDKKDIERLYSKVKKGDVKSIDSIFVVAKLLICDADVNIDSNGTLVLISSINCDTRVEYSARLSLAILLILSPEVISVIIRLTLTISVKLNVVGSFIDDLIVVHNEDNTLALLILSLFILLLFIPCVSISIVFIIESDVFAI